MKITLFTQDKDCHTIGSFNCSHVCMFERDFSTELHFVDVPEEIRFITCCAEYFIPINVVGRDVTLLVKMGNFQRVRYRFD